MRQQLGTQPVGAAQTTTTTTTKTRLICHVLFVQFVFFFWVLILGFILAVLAASIGNRPRSGDRAWHLSTN